MITSQIDYGQNIDGAAIDPYLFYKLMKLNSEIINIIARDTLGWVLELLLLAS